MEPISGCTVLPTYVLLPLGTVGIATWVSVLLVLANEPAEGYHNICLAIRILEENP